MVTLSQFFLPAPDLATRMADALADEGVVVQAGGVKAPHILAAGACSRARPFSTSRASWTSAS